jgi:hypothetical protein
LEVVAAMLFEDADAGEIPNIVIPIGFADAGERYRVILKIYQPPIPIAVVALGLARSERTMVQ